MDYPASNPAVMSSCEAHPQGHLDLFPYHKVRKIQDLFLEDARWCMQERNTLLAHASTGMGKTAVSITAALEASIDAGGVVLFLTSRQTQHAAAVEALIRIHQIKPVGVVDLISREDMCLSKSGECDGACYFRQGALDEAREVILASPKHVQHAMRVCIRHGVCPYLACLSAAKGADVVVGDHNHLFSTPLIDGLGRREVFVIVDEAHNLPSRITDAFSLSIAPDEVNRLARCENLRPFTEDLLTLEAIARGILRRHSHEQLLTQDINEELMSRCGTDMRGLASEIRGIGRRLDRGALEFVHTLEWWGRHGEEAIRYADKKEERLRCRLISPAAVAAPAFHRVSCSLLMSGTLHPPEMYADILGLENSVCREYPNPFPEENRLVLSIGGVSSRYRERGARTYDQMAKRICEIASVVPGNMIAFFPSYHFLKGVAQRVPGDLGKTVITERTSFGKNERDSIVARMEMERCMLLMASINGSFSEGVDFRDNMLDAVIVAGLPLNPPSLIDEMREMRLEKQLGRRKARQYLHTYPAISKVLQAAGRAIRSDTDRAVIVLIDDRYHLPHIRSSFPADLRPTASIHPLEAIREFLMRRDECAVEAVLPQIEG